MDCKATLQAAPKPSVEGNPWLPRSSIDDKQKDGDQEQFSILWAAHECIVTGREVGSEGFETDRKQFARESRALPTKTKEEVALKKGRVEQLLEALTQALGADHGQFLINLAMLGYRTSGGGRARKVSNLLRSLEDGEGTPDVYLRPFEDPLPFVIRGLVGIIQTRGLAPAGNLDQLAFQEGASSGKYVPPSRFTASFPLTLTQSHESPPLRTLSDPRFPSGGSGAQDPRIKYSYMGSFGFSEPSYTSWKAETDGPEYDGTRLSLGAYSLDETYLLHLLGLLRQALAKDSEHRKGYKGYGGVRIRHVEALLVVAKKSGHALALAWVRQLAEVANVLAHAAGKKAGQGGQAGLAAFFHFVQGRIHRRAMKLDVLKARPGDLSAFDHIWVLESSLWELAFMGATCLSLPELRDALGSLPELASHWKPSVGTDETALHETLQNVPTGQLPQDFNRIYAPTGTTAAKCLSEVLLRMNYQVHEVTPSPDTLDPFVPYFEFYMGGFLNAPDVPMAAVGTQVWVNLSDSLHTKLLKPGLQAPNPGTVIAGMLAQYVAALGVDDTVPMLLVVDFTKFGGEMPNSHLYPILAQLACALVTDHGVQHVVFLRSNLKFNTGPLDRYQSGEILVYRQGPGNLLARLRTRMTNAFVDGMVKVDIVQAWGLEGEYVPLMKKVYLLSDAISCWRWARYAAEW
ncbi:hypothetical protein [Corallococcus exercitus]|uniref:Uncharacterized protein n=1 Tax=Corallococcus exercitus TaxID=2316736 RepID=A0A7Y4JMP0_9BACT|nr:hypothetical protein [Corallococcus exercitus]NOK07879.1 hypothetical protein [Corallococcus exercitus]